MADVYAPLHPELFQYREEILAPMDAVQSIGDHIFLMRLFHESWIDGFLEEIDHYESWAKQVGIRPRRPNSMNEHGLVLADLGLRSFFDRVLEEVINPRFQSRFNDVLSEALGDQHAFTVHYGDAGDDDLGFHVDDSDVTVNLCLDDRAEGSEMILEGRRCFRHLDSAPRQEEVLRYEHRRGMAIIHAGKERHRVLPVKSGDRKNLILWCRESSGPTHMVDECPTWCGFRDDSSPR